MKGKYVFLTACLILALSARGIMAHCEIPCGIYNDEIRIALIREHIDTIEKSIKMIKSLTGEADRNYNQIVRWIDNKETHAGEIQQIVYQYFLTQRIRPVDDAGAGHDAYIEKLTLLHQLLIAAMKSKQTLEPEHVGFMRELVGRFEALYFVKD